jgi:hypothetical protein
LIFEDTTSGQLCTNASLNGYQNRTGHEFNQPLVCFIEYATRFKLSLRPVATAPGSDTNVRNTICAKPVKGISWQVF